MKEKFQFLCGNFQKLNYIYGIKFAKHPWHYFEELDTLASEHNLLPDLLHSRISTLDKVRPIEACLSAEQSKHYFSDGKFIFKKKELKTRLALVNQQFDDNLDDKPSKTKSMRKSTVDLLFICGTTNPLLFVNEFEKCTDVKTDNDKMFKIVNFVNDSDRVEFRKLYFTSDWATVRQVFLKKYSMSFTINKKRALNIDFWEEKSLRSFVERKLLALSTYTTLPFINQMEIVLNDLPCEISSLFMIKEVMYRGKTQIFEFCDYIQALAETMQEKSDEEPETVPNIQNSMNQMEVFNFDPDLESSEIESVASSQAIGRGRGPGRPPKNLSESSSLTDESLNSPWTDSELSTVEIFPQFRGKTKGQRGGRGKVVKRRRVVKKERPSRVLKTVDKNTCSTKSGDSTGTD